MNKGIVFIPILYIITEQQHPEATPAQEEDILDATYMLPKARVLGAPQEARPRKRLKKSKRKVSARTHEEATMDQSNRLGSTERGRLVADAQQSNGTSFC